MDNRNNGPSKHDTFNLAGLVLAQRRRQCANIKAALVYRFVFVDIYGMLHHMVGAVFF